MKANPLNSHKITGILRNLLISNGSRASFIILFMTEYDSEEVQVLPDLAVYTLLISGFKYILFENFFLFFFNLFY